VSEVVRGRRRKVREVEAFFSSSFANEKRPRANYYFDLMRTHLASLLGRFCFNNEVRWHAPDFL